MPTLPTLSTRSTLTLFAALALVITGANVAFWLWFTHHINPNPPAPPLPPISLPASVQAHVGRIATIEATTTGKTVRWAVLSGPDKPDLLIHDAHAVHFVTPTPGDYRLQAITVVAGDPELAETHVLVDVGPTPPVPPGPVPPGPVPPVPPPTPPPIPAAGFHALIVYEVGALGKYKPEQRAILYSDQVRAYLSSKAAVGPDGKTPEWRLFDKDEDTTFETQLWKDAMKRPRKSLPWVILSDGKTGFEGPLPENEADALTLFQKYGG